MAAQPAQLVAVSEGPNILLDKPILLIGRHQECDIQIPSRKISRRHCCIAQVDDHLIVRDLCSTNGIRINGVRVNEGQLKSGDELTIGNFRYQVNWSAQPGAPAMAPPPPVKNAPKLAPLERDPFDSCEEPIPIAEPEPFPQKASNRPTNLAQPAIDKDQQAAPPSLVFPENLKLAPLSDSQMNQPK
jgi:predicted component of type VI protein secretion system